MGDSRLMFSCEHRMCKNSAYEIIKRSYNYDYLITVAGRGISVVFKAHHDKNDGNLAEMCCSKKPE
jgi:hypothetical protein